MNMVQRELCLMCPVYEYTNRDCSKCPNNLEERLKDESIQFSRCKWECFLCYGVCFKCNEKVGYNPSDIAEYRKKATSGDYDMLLCLSMEMIDNCNEKLSLTDEEDDYED